MYVKILLTDEQSQPQNASTEAVENDLIAQYNPVVYHNKKTDTSVQHNLYLKEIPTP